MSPGQALDVRYEDLILDPAAELTRLCRFLGYPYDDRMLNYSDHTSYDKPDPSLLFQWKTRQTPREIQLVESRAHDWITRHGYDLSGGALTPPGPRQRARLALEDKWQVWAMRISRYGIRDPLVAAIGRRLGLTGLQRRAQARIDEKVVKRLK